MLYMPSEQLNQTSVVQQMLHGLKKDKSLDLLQDILFLF